MRQDVYEQAARTAHEANLMARAVLMEEAGVPWDELGDEARLALVQSAAHHLEAGMPLTPEEQHARWMVARLSDGWTFGVIYDPAAKEHPDLQDFSQLAPESRMKTVVYLAVMAAFRARAVTQAGL